MEEDISSIEEQNKSCRTKKISHKSNIRKFFRDVWRKIKAEINGEERKRANEYGDYYF